MQARSHCRVLSNCASTKLCPVNVCARVARKQCARLAAADSSAARTPSVAACASRDATQQGGVGTLLRHAATGVLSLALSLAAVTHDPSAALAEMAPPLYDGAKVVASDLRDGMTQDLEQLERNAGWKVRVYTAYGGPLARSEEQTPRELWGPPDNRTLWVNVDPSSPNIINMVYVGDDVLFKLRRPFLQEVQSRYGNMFYVRDNGESKAVQQAVGALTQCLGAPEGCKVVPGLPADQYYFTLAFSMVGGLIAGFVSKLEPQGFVQRKWVWLLVFAPLWGPLFVNYGIGPVVSRTSDIAPVLGNCAGFVVAAALPYLDKVMARPPQQGERM